MKEVKIEIPKGYIIDEENSTFECIKFKKKEEISIKRYSTISYKGVTIKTPDTEFILLDTYEVLTTWENTKKHCKTIYSTAEFPSKEQWNIIYKYKEEINKYLENKIGNGSYWISEEKNPFDCWYMNMNDGTVKNTYCGCVNRVRPIINL